MRSSLRIDREISVAFDKGEDGTFFGSMWDNAVGECDGCLYVG